MKKRHSKKQQQKKNIIKGENHDGVTFFSDYEFLFRPNYSNSFIFYNNKNYKERGMKIKAVRNGRFLYV